MRMSRTPREVRDPSGRPRRIGAAVTSIAVAVLISAAAAAAGVTLVVGEAANKMLGETVVVDVHGRTLYALHPETTHHLLCRSRACLEAWPPLTVRTANVKLQAGHGVQGRLALLRRGNGKLQVTLRGMPLYRFAGDSAKGQANGDGIKSFGGTWHAATAAAHPTIAPQGTTPPTTSTPTAPPPVYGY
jgi:predicted lipoprotein with Yx(FWY)xxD motif